MSRPRFAEVTMESMEMRSASPPSVSKPSEEPKAATCDVCGSDLIHMALVNTDRCTGCGRTTEHKAAPPLSPGNKATERLEGLRPPTSAPSTENAKESGEGPISKTAS